MMLYTLTIHKTSEEDFEVLEDMTDIPRSHLAFTSTMTLVRRESRLDECALVLRKPLGFFWEVRDEPKDDDGRDDGEYTLLRMC